MCKGSRNVFGGLKPHLDRKKDCRTAALNNYYTPSSGTMASVFPNGASSFRMVLRLGTEVPFFILAITGCLTPLNCSSSLWESPFSLRALMISPTKATLRLLSAISSGANRSFCTSFQVLNVLLIKITPVILKILYTNKSVFPQTFINSVAVECPFRSVIILLHFE